MALVALVYEDRIERLFSNVINQIVQQHCQIVAPAQANVIIYVRYSSTPRVVEELLPLPAVPGKQIGLIAMVNGQMPIETRPLQQAADFFALLRISLQRIFMQELQADSSDIVDRNGLISMLNRINQQFGHHVQPFLGPLAAPAAPIAAGAHTASLIWLEPADEKEYGNEIRSVIQRHFQMVSFEPNVIFVIGSKATPRTEDLKIDLQAMHLNPQQTALIIIDHVYPLYLDRSQLEPYARWIVKLPSSIVSGNTPQIRATILNNAIQSINQPAAHFAKLYRKRMLPKKRSSRRATRRK